MNVLCSFAQARKEVPKAPYSNNNNNSSKNDGDLTVAEFQDELVHLSDSNDSNNIVWNQYEEYGGIVYKPIVAPICDNIMYDDHKKVWYENIWNNIYKWWHKGSNSYDSDNHSFSNSDNSFNKGNQDEYEQNRIFNDEEIINNDIVTPVKRSHLMMKNSKIEHKVRDFAWHPTKSLWAIALADDSIFFYDMVEANWQNLILEHQFQREISCIQWNPMGNELAIACKYGVAVWKIVSSVGTRRTAWMTWLRHDKLTNIHIIEYSPCGRYLAVGSKNHNSFIIFNRLRGTEYVRLRGTTNYSEGISTIKWSPNGRYLFIGTTGQTRTLWNTKDWSKRIWNAKSECCGASWHALGEILLVATFRESHSFINIVSFEIQAQVNLSQNCIDVSEEIVEPNVTVGGKVDRMIWSPTGERLVVSFDNSKPGSELLAVFGCNRKQNSLISCHLVGYIRGPKIFDQQQSSYPISFDFRKHVENGALLGVVWSNGSIMIIPMIFGR